MSGFRPCTHLDIPFSCNNLILFLLFSGSERGDGKISTEIIIVIVVGILCLLLILGVFLYVKALFVRIEEDRNQLHRTLSV